MFNSTLLDDYSILQQSIQERQIEIIEFKMDLWTDNPNEFVNIFEPFLPPGFIDRDLERAKNTIREIWNIVQSPVIRYNPKAIHCYVMYHMIDAWFDDEYTQMQVKLLPDKVKTLLEGIKEPDGSDENLSKQDRIRQWFTDKDSCLGDFEDAYDPDYMDETVAEGAAEVYLNNGFVPVSLGVDLKEIVDLLPNDLYFRLVEKLKQNEIEANRYVEAVWPRMEGFFHTFSHSEAKLTSYQGAIDILWTFKDWVENNGGWRDVRGAGSEIKEETIQRMIHLGAKTYLVDKNLDLTREGNLGVGQEDFKISRGNDKTVIEVKLTSNPKCRRGFEKQLPRYAEAEHTDNMIFCLVDLGNNPKVVEEIKGLQGNGKPKLVIIDARQQKPASVL